MMSWNYKEMWGSLGWLKDDLEQAEASLQAKWSREHSYDGSHADVAAASLTGQWLNIGAPYVVDIPAENNTGVDSPGVVLRLPRKASSILLRAEFPSPGVFSYGVHAIEMPGVVPGDVLVVMSNVDSGVRLISSATLPGTVAGGTPYYPVGNRILLRNTDFTSTGSGPTFDYWAYPTQAVTLLRVDYMDYDEPSEGMLYPAWVQIG
jgi:hypothetical protein